MSRKIKGSSNIYDYLEGTGLLTNGTAEQITAAKIEYWKLKRKEWKQERRKKNSSYTVFLNSLELRIIKRASKDFQGGITNYLKQSGLAMSNECTLIDTRIIGKLHEAIVLLYMSLRDITEAQNIKDTSPLLENIDQIDKMILSLMQNHKTQSHIK